MMTADSGVLSLRKIMSLYTRSVHLLMQSLLLFPIRLRRFANLNDACILSLVCM